MKGRHRPAGRNAPSLPLLFFRYYLVSLLALVLIITAVGVLVDRVYDSLNEDTGRNFMHGTATLIERELQRQPPADWDRTIAALSRQFSFRVALSSLDRLGDLDPELRGDIVGGTMRYDTDVRELYVRIGNSNRVLELGPLQIEAGDDDSLLSAGTHAKVLWWLLTGMGFGLLLLLQIWPVWRDLTALRAAADRLAAGDLGTRVPATRSRLLAPLADTLNGMAARLQEQVGAQQALSHAVAHELRTPIARLRFGLTMLDEADTPDEALRYRNDMETDMRELDELVNASMSYAQLDQDPARLRMEPVELRPWFTDLTELMQPLANGIRLELACVDGTAEFDRKLMCVVMRNLLVNALRYAASTVRLTVCRRDGLLDIAVDDDGPGIPPAERLRVFEPFHRVDDSRDRSTGNFGLGLAFVRLIVTRHGGRVRAVNSPLGGARLEVTLPAEPRPG